MNNYKAEGVASTLYLFYIRKLSRHPFSKKFRRFVSNRFFPRGIRVVSPHGSEFRISTFDYIDQQLIFKGNYEEKSVEKAIHLLKDGGVFVDIGANFGLFSLHAAKNPAVEVYSFEPNPRMFDKLSRHVEINQAKNCRLFSMALGNEAGIAGISCPALNNSGNYQLSTENIEFYVSCIRLSDIIRKFEIQQIILIKIDVEGFEYQVLQGIDWEVVKPQYILMEYIPGQLDAFGTDARVCLDFLISKGYEAFDVFDEKFDDFSQSPFEQNLIFKRPG